MKRTLVAFIVSLGIVAAISFPGCQKRAVAPSATGVASNVVAQLTPPAGGAEASQAATSTTEASEAAATDIGAAPTDDLQKAHEESAVIALSDVKVALAQNEYDKAFRLARQATKDYADTAYARDFTDLTAQAEQAMAEQVRAQQDQTQAQQQERHQRFVQYRDRGLDAFTRKDYPAAVLSLRSALQEEEDADVRYAFEQSVAKTTRPRVAVADFTVSGDIGIPDAGRSVAELMLSKFDPEKYQLIERSHLADILGQRDLTMAQVGSNPELLSNKKIATVQYLVVGTVISMGQVTITARVVDVSDGTIVNSAEVDVPRPSDLQPALADLAMRLQMSPEEKQQYLAQRQAEDQADQQAQQQEQQRLAEESQRFEEARRADWIAQQMATWMAQQRDEARERAWRRHNQDALRGLADVRALMSQQDWDPAARLARHGVQDFGDTRFARDFVNLLFEAESHRSHPGDDGDHRGGNDGDRDRAGRDGGNDGRDGGRDEVGAFAVAVPDFALAADVPSGGGPSFSELALSKLNAPYKPLPREKFLQILQANHLDMSDVQRNPLALKGKRIMGLRYVLIGTVSGNRIITVKETLYDLREGKVVKTGQAGTDKVRSLNQAVFDATANLQMPDQQKQEQEQKQQRYAAAITKARQFERDLKWPEAMDAYKQATDVDPTDEAKSGMDKAREKLNEAATMSKKDRYNKALADAKAAMEKQDYQQAADRIEEAMAVDPKRSEAKQLLSEMGSVVLVTAELDGQEYAGATVKVNGQEQRQGTPASIRIRADRPYRIDVTIPATGGKHYTTASKSTTMDHAGLLRFRAVIREDTKPRENSSGPAGASSAPTTPVVAPPKTEPRVDTTPPLKPRSQPVIKPIERGPAGQVTPEVKPQTQPTSLPAPARSGGGTSTLTKPAAKGALDEPVVKLPERVTSKPANRITSKPAERVIDKPAVEKLPPVEKKLTDAPVIKPIENATSKPSEKVLDKRAAERSRGLDKVSDRPSDKPTLKVDDKATSKPVDKASDAPAKPKLTDDPARRIGSDATSQPTSRDSSSRRSRR